MAGGAPHWGLCATVKAPGAAILRFAAWHLEAGAHRLFLYLDAPSEAAATLSAHPKVRVTLCDDGWWQRQGGRRPVKHQVRQGANATHAYGRAAAIDWLAHVDVDEFLWCEGPLAGHLAALPDAVLTARVRPAEALGGTRDLYKAFVPAGPDRTAIVARLYPTFGDHLRGGFVSHVAGKVLVRTGLANMTIRIHNAVRGEAMNPGEAELPGVRLLHRHATDWQDWMQHYRFRRAQGSYRPDLPPARPADRGGLTLHQLLGWLEDTEGEAGLRAFYDEVISDGAGLPDRLAAEGLLRHHALRLDALVAKHFPA